jgi:hypothetical protein
MNFLVNIFSFSALNIAVVNILTFLFVFYYISKKIQWNFFHIKIYPKLQKLT